jgi:hypothetical protein
LISKQRHFPNSKPPPIFGHTRIPIYLIHHKPIHHEALNNNCEPKKYIEPRFKSTCSQCPLCNTAVLLNSATNETISQSSKYHPHLNKTSFPLKISALKKKNSDNNKEFNNSEIQSNDLLKTEKKSINNQDFDISKPPTNSLPSTRPTPPPPPPPPPPLPLNLGEDYSKLIKLNWNKFEPDSIGSNKSIWSELDRIEIDENKIKELFTVNKDGTQNFVRF